MPNGRHGDNPLNDILVHGSSEFGEPVDSLVKKLAAHPRFQEFEHDIHTVLIDHWPAFDSGRENGGTKKAAELLGDIQNRMDKKPQ